MSTRYLATSESVSPGHPDKICDQISDAFVDAALDQDPSSRVAVETGVKGGLSPHPKYAPLIELLGPRNALRIVEHGLVFVEGELTTRADIDPEKLVRDTVSRIGYPKSLGFDEDCFVFPALNAQSADISQGVGRGSLDDQGAGDQGHMFGYATDETPEFMPAPIMFAHRIVRGLDVARGADLSWLRPDGKSQVTVLYENDRPVEVVRVVVAAQHADHISSEEIEESIIESVVKGAIPPELLKNPEYCINGTGRFVVGGPVGDSGVTGRKIIVDTYGGAAPHGGGAFSGKDPSKVDRSAAYAARWAAKNVVGAGLARKCLIQVSYGIGRAEPTSLTVKTYGTGLMGDDNGFDERLTQIVSEVFPWRPGRIIEALELVGPKKPKYGETARYGHFGREDAGFSWERLNKVAALKARI